MKVYIITEGSYSDYHIVGVTTEMETAERYLELHDKYHEMKIEEHDTNFIWYMERPDVHLYKVMYTSNGMYQCDVIDKSRVSSGGYDLNEVIKGRFPSEYWVFIFARDREHALKVGRDMIAEYRANDNGIVVY